MNQNPPGATVTSIRHIWCKVRYKLLRLFTCLFFPWDRTRQWILLTLAKKPSSITIFLRSRGFQMDNKMEQKLWIPWSCNIENSLFHVYIVFLWLEFSRVLPSMINRVTLSYSLSGIVRVVLSYFLSIIIKSCLHSYILHWMISYIITLLRRPSWNFFFLFHGLIWTSLVPCLREF